MLHYNIILYILNSWVHLILFGVFIIPLDFIGENDTWKRHDWGMRCINREMDRLCLLEIQRHSVVKKLECQEGSSERTETRNEIYIILISSTEIFLKIVTISTWICNVSIPVARAQIVGNSSRDTILRLEIGCVLVTYLLLVRRREDWGEDWHRFLIDVRS